MKEEQTMKKNRLFMMAGALCAALGLGSCSNEMDEVAVPAEGATRTVTLTVSLPDRGADTRTAYAADGAGLKVTWADGDKLTASGKDWAKSTTFKLTSGAGETTATFTGDLPEDVSEGDNVGVAYPEIKTEVIDGETHYIYPDYRTQDGTLAGLSKVDAFSFFAQYSGGKLTSIECSRLSSFLHFAKGTQVASAGGKATFTISGAVAANDLTADKYIIEDIVVSNVAVNSEGKLEDDVYIAFEYSIDNTPTLTINLDSETKVYNLDKEFEQGHMYNISDMSQLSGIIAPIANPAVGLVIGANGKYYANKASAEADNTTAEAMIAYLGKVDGVCDTGLAIALVDASSSTVTWADAASTVSTWANDPPVTGGTWRLPSAKDWMYMFKGCGSESTIRDMSSTDGSEEFDSEGFKTKLQKVGGEDLSANYWTGSQYSDMLAWLYQFGSGQFGLQAKQYKSYARAVLVF